MKKRYKILPIDNVEKVPISEDKIIVIEKFDDFSHGHNFPNEGHQFIRWRFAKQIHCK